MSRRALWLLGDARIAASPSPLLHDAVFGAGTYALHPAEDAARAFAAAEATCRGVNVTAPFKIAAAERYAAVLDDAARSCGAVNTVVYDDDGRATVAANTDVEGLLVAWRRAAFTVRGQSVAVVGAGGAARAVVVAAGLAGAAGVVVHARRSEAAVALATYARGLGVAARPVEPRGDADRAPLVIVAASDLVDVDGWLARALAPGGAVHDLRYGPRARPMRDAALRRGARFTDGATMLLGQAMVTAALFLGRPLVAAQQQEMTRAMADWLRQQADAR
ncbi:MAG: hypothetical protein FJ137_11385 [Deltaproteobacteria bacterium]|nr:hypothetical protein [Deltaproteobacteria bacterium]